MENPLTAGTCQRILISQIISGIKRIHRRRCKGIILRILQSQAGLVHFRIFESSITLILQMRNPEQIFLETGIVIFAVFEYNIGNKTISQGTEQRNYTPGFLQSQAGLVHFRIFESSISLILQMRNPELIFLETGIVIFRRFRMGGVCWKSVRILEMAPGVTTF
ncbi:hypothetical protein CEXT_17871 [Caerostris extrusa]|uniref:Uncharacterized protein n=1 Tax=Caerostris extrusa TaxID=172846 RepID=A0AAV4P3I5_CAEEX|nr:hypothetical protein CEXT_17871 [Caerostris extrusa]